MNYRLQVLFSLLVIAAGPAAAQTFPVSGRVLDAQDQSPLLGATVVLTHLAADSAHTGLAVDGTGGFTLSPVASGPYRLVVSFVGYQALVRAVTISSTPLQLGTLSLQPGGVVLKGVEITGRAAAAVQNGDTTQYNAQAFKTNPDASAQDLLTKMPGVLVDPSTGKLQAQGEQVRRVLVDGKEYFGTDPDAVLKNLPAEAIAQIQVYDRASDQAQFTGFDDGNQQKTINIVTKPRFRNGEFGRVVDGGGSSDDAQMRYRASGTVNSFHGKQRLSLIAQTNNVNEQNFGTDDGKSAGGGGSASSGISTTTAVGLNYSNVWNKKTDAQASYFFSRVGNTLSRQTERRFTAPDSLGRTLRYTETSLAGSTNITNRFNLRLEHKFDSANSVLWQPRLSVQHTDSHNHLSGATSRSQPPSEAVEELRSVNLSDYQADNQGLAFGQQLLYRHRFRKRGRTFSLGLNIGYTPSKTENYLNSLNEDYTASATGQPVTTHTDQLSNVNQVGWQGSATATYNEPLSRKSQVQFSYTANYTPSNSDKKTYNLDGTTNTYTALNPDLSNVFQNHYRANAGEVSYRYSSRGFQGTVGAQVQAAQQRNDQTFPKDLSTRRSFVNVLPSAQLRYNFSKHQNLRLTYRMRTDAPSISQLQEVVNNANPLQITTGNPNLRQENTHTLAIRYSSANVARSTSFFTLLSGSLTSNNITNSTTVLTQSTAIGGVIVPAGGQITQPVNLDGLYSVRAVSNYSLPLSFVKSNLNLNANANFTQTPGLVAVGSASDQQLNYSRTPSVGLGAVVSSNISPALDFTLSSNSSQTYVRNSTQTTANRSYFRQNTTLRFSWIFWKGISVQSNVNHTAYTGLSAGYNQHYILWNASLGKKLFARQQAEVKVYAFDILKQNNSITPNQTAAYVEDVHTNILTRYLMLMFTYNIRNFPAGS